MRTIALFTFCWISVSAYHGTSEYLNRNKRDAVGALDIVTNNAQAIHADVKHEASTQDVADKVLPPIDAVYEGKSLRKSLPHGTASTLDIVRSVNRLIALVVLAITMAIEFYPLIANLVNIVLHFLEI